MDTPTFLGNSPVELSDDVKKDLLRKLDHDASKSIPDYDQCGASAEDMKADAYLKKRMVPTIG